MSKEVFQEQEYVLWHPGILQNLEKDMEGEEKIQKGCLLCTIADRDGLKSFHVTINVHWPCIQDSGLVLLISRGYYGALEQVFTIEKM